MAWLLADLHIHTALSPCADGEMTPPAIIRAARERGVSLIAVCDHNSAGNVAAVQEAARKEVRRTGDWELTVIAGMEITTAEEVHLLGLFPDAERAEQAAAEVLGTLPPWKPPAGSRSPGVSVRPPGSGRLESGASPGVRARPPGSSLWEQQSLLDAGGRVVGSEERMLGAASTLALADGVRLIRNHGGLAVAAHLDRPSFSVLSQLGFLPEEVRFDAVEISAYGAAPERRVRWRDLGMTLLSSSDSHYLNTVGCSCTLLEVRAPTFEELVLAVHGEQGRRCGIA